MLAQCQAAVAACVGPAPPTSADDTADPAFVMDTIGEPVAFVRRAPPPQVQPQAAAAAEAVAPAEAILRRRQRLPASMLLGRWAISEKWTCEVDGQTCTFSNGRAYPVERTDVGSVAINRWRLCGATADTLTWVQDGKKVRWQRCVEVIEDDTEDTGLADAPQQGVSESGAALESGAMEECEAGTADAPADEELEAEGLEEVAAEDGEWAEAYAAEDEAVDSVMEDVADLAEATEAAVLREAAEAEAAEAALAFGEGLGVPAADGEGDQLLADGYGGGAEAEAAESELEVAEFVEADAEDAIAEDAASAAEGFAAHEAYDGLDDADFVEDVIGQEP